MAITDLIAQQQGPDPIGAMGRAYQLAGMKQELAKSGEAEKQRKRQEGAMFAANTALQLEKVQDPLQRAQIYQRQLQAAEQAGYDVRPFPMQYDERAQGLLNFFKGQVYGGKEYEANLANSKPVKLKPEETLLDPTTNQVIAEGKPKPPPTTELEKLITARDRLPAGHPDRKTLEMAIANKSAPKQGITISPDGTIQIGGSSQGLDKTVNRESQQAIISAGQSLDRLKAIKENYDRNFLTYQGRVGNFLSSVKSKAGADLTDEERSALRQRRRFTQGVNAEFNAYRKLITGAAASVQELESLKKAMISEDLSPDEFEAAFNEYSSELSRTIRIRNKLMREGLQPGTKQFGERLDGLFLRGDDDDVNARGAELEQQGLGTDEILDILDQEGYGY